MTEDLSEMSVRELERLAYARVDSGARRERSIAAGEELARRADAARHSSPTRLELDRSDEPLATDSESPVGVSAAPGSPRRKVAVLVGIAGTFIVVLVATIASWVSFPSAQNPLAIFDEPATQLDADWATRLEMSQERTITLGPRVIELGKDMYGIAYKAVAPPSNVGPQPDLYCLTVAEMPENSGGWGSNHSCVTPTEFERAGVSVDIVPLSAGGATTGSLDWGPTGYPNVNPAAAADRSRATLPDA